MVKFYTFYEDKPQNFEVNDQPSLTDDSFFEPLENLVARILRGESTTLDISTANAGNYDFDDIPDDSVFDADVSDIDDLTDIDVLKDRLRRVENELKNSKKSSLIDEQDLAGKSNVQVGGVNERLAQADEGVQPSQDKV